MVKYHFTCVATSTSIILNNNPVYLLLHIKPRYDIISSDKNLTNSFITSFRSFLVFASNMSKENYLHITTLFPSEKVHGLVGNCFMKKGRSCTVFGFYSLFFLSSCITHTVGTQMNFLFHIWNKSILFFTNAKMRNAIRLCFFIAL